jgi:hypothetical protein
VGGNPHSESGGPPKSASQTCCAGKWRWQRFESVISTTRRTLTVAALVIAVAIVRVPVPVRFGLRAIVADEPVIMRVAAGYVVRDAAAIIERGAPVVVVDYVTVIIERRVATDLYAGGGNGTHDAAAEHRAGGEPRERQCEQAVFHDSSWFRLVLASGMRPPPLRTEMLAEALQQRMLHQGCQSMLRGALPIACADGVKSE